MWYAEGIYGFVLFSFWFGSGLMLLTCSILINALVRLQRHTCFCISFPDLPSCDDLPTGSYHQTSVWRKFPGSECRKQQEITCN